MTMQDLQTPLEPAWLRTFLAVAEHRNYTRAAQALFLSQSAVSRQMQALQRALGLALVEQLGKRLALTAAGRDLLPHAEQLRAGLGRAVEALEPHRLGRGGRLRVGASTTPGLYLLPDALAAFAARHPDTSIEFRVADSRTIGDALARNDLDLGFVGGPAAREDLSSEVVAEDRIAVYAASRHPLAGRRQVRPAALVTETFVVRPVGSATRDAFDSWLDAKGLRLRRTIEIACPEAAKRLVEAGIGLSISSRYGLSRARDARLVRLPVTGLDLGRQILALRHRDKRESAAASALVEAVRERAGVG
jgi:DNA-binding transcriptional LysR family regulator